MEPQATNLDDAILQAAQENTNENAIDPQEAQLNAFWMASNVTGLLSDQELDQLANDLLQAIERDEESRSAWRDKVEDYFKLAAQVVEHKSFPWHRASNIKFPLLTMAAIQFQSRAYKGIVQNNNIAKARVMGRDDFGMKAARAKNVAQHMSYQLLEEMPSWEEELDTLLMVLPIIGNVFRKTYFDGKTVTSELVLPQDVIVNYYAKNVEKARRKTHIIELHKNDIVGMMRSGFFREIDLSAEAEEPENRVLEDALHEGQDINPPSEDPDTPHEVYECHCWLDLDKDGFEEPYKVYIVHDLEKVIRIAPRYMPDGVIRNAKGDVIDILPVEEFTNFRFVPDPNSGVYGLGFGHILGPLNEATNTIINQLVDAGTLNILPSGFLARGVRIRSGEHPLQPGEWRYVTSSGDDLRKGIFPLPIKEPSAVLFNLLSFLAETGMSLASVTDMMRGENPGQNQPFSTTKSVLEQGLSVYSAIFKRIYRSLKGEFKKIYTLNKYYLPEQVYFSILDIEGEQTTTSVQRTDYQMDDIDIIPAADPNQVADILEIAKAEQLMMLAQMGVVNPQEAGRRLLLAQDHEDVAALLDVPEPQPNVDQQIEMQRLELDKQTAERNADITEVKVAYQAARDKAAATEKYANVMINQVNMELERAQFEFDKEKEIAQNEISMLQEQLDAMRGEREGAEEREHESEMKDKDNEAKSKAEGVRASGGSSNNKS